MTSVTRIDQNHRRSRAVVHNGLVYTAGQVADDTKQDIAGQTRQVLAKIDELLKQAGTGKRHLLSAQVMLNCIDDLPGFNAVWDEWVVPGQTPTRVCSTVQLNNPAYRVEVLVVAVIDQA